jgi:hypothetical protein
MAGLPCFELADYLTEPTIAHWIIARREQAHCLILYRNDSTFQGFRKKSGEAKMQQTDLNNE